MPGNTEVDGLNNIKTLLVGINAKYIHSNPAIRYIQKFLRANGLECTILEFTINQQPERLVSEICKQKPDILGFSCYIWNIRIVRRIISDIRIILPDTIIVLGGPEIGDDTYEADYIIVGDGESSFLELVSALGDNTVSKPSQNIAGYTDFAQTVFPYDNEDFEALSGRIIYYEAQRGCPFKCAYCLSSRKENVRYLPYSRVFGELSAFLEKRVKQVKFVDRTFNSDKSFSRKIWKYLIENDNGITNFHFEIVAELLDSEDFELLKCARKSLFQFEIGVQTTNEKTLKEIERFSDFQRLSDNVCTLSKSGNIRLHLDLIAGLPYEGLTSFRKSFNDVFMLRPDILQLGFLKVLKGSRIRENADIYGLKYSTSAPYEVLCTDAISYSELQELKNAEHILETYYNSNLARQSIKYILQFFETPFDFFHKLGKFWDDRGYGGVQHSKAALYTIFYEFMEQNILEFDKLRAAKDIIVYDMLLNDNIKTFPEQLTMPTTNEQNLFVSNLYGDSERLAKIDARLLQFNKKQLRKACNVFFSNYAVHGGFEKKETVIFFHYLDGGGKGVAHDLITEA